MADANPYVSRVKTTADGAGSDPTLRYLAASDALRTSESDILQDIMRNYKERNYKEVHALQRQLADLRAHVIYEYGKKMQNNDLKELQDTLTQSKNWLLQVYAFGSDPSKRMLQAPVGDSTKPFIELEKILKKKDMDKAREGAKKLSESGNEEPAALLPPLPESDSEQVVVLPTDDETEQGRPRRPKRELSQETAIDVSGVAVNTLTSTEATKVADVQPMDQAWYADPATLAAQQHADFARFVLIDSLSAIMSGVQLAFSPIDDNYVENTKAVIGGHFQQLKVPQSVGELQAYFLSLVKHYTGNTWSEYLQDVYDKSFARIQILTKGWTENADFDTTQRWANHTAAIVAAMQAAQPQTVMIQENQSVPRQTTNYMMYNALSAEDKADVINAALLKIRGDTNYNGKIIRSQDLLQLATNALYAKLATSSKIIPLLPMQASRSDADDAPVLAEVTSDDEEDLGEWIPASGTDKEE